MNILFLSTTFPDADSPARGTYNSALVRGLRRDHEVTVISPRFFTEVYSRNGRKHSFVPPADLAELGVQIEYPTYWYTPRFFQFAYGGQMWWSVRKCVQDVLQKFKPDAVLSYWAHPDGDVGQRIAASLQIPSAVIVGGTDVLVLPHLRGRGPSVRRVLNASSAVFTVSDGLNLAVQKLGIPAEQVVTIYQGVDDHHFDQSRTRRASRQRLGLSEETSHLLWVGRMVEIKALPVLMEAAAKLRERGRPFQLHLLGNGPQQEPMRQLAARLGLGECVHFHGAVGHDAIVDWYRAADLTVLCSDSEGLPNVLRESLACGTPFVSSDVGSVREILYGDASRLVPRRDPLALADAIESMLTPEARQAAAAYVPRSWQETAWETARLLDALRRKSVSSPESFQRQSPESVVFGEKT